MKAAAAAMETSQSTVHDDTVKAESWILEWPDYNIDILYDNDDDGIAVNDGAKTKTKKQQQQRKPVTTRTNLEILQAVLSVAKHEFPTEVDQVQQLLVAMGSSSNSKWRSNYDQIYEAIVQIQVKASVETCVAMCQAGIDTANTLFVIRNHNTKDRCTVTKKLSEAFVRTESIPSKQLTTIECANNVNIDERDSIIATFPLAVTSKDGKTTTLVRGSDAIDQVNCWLKYGCMEPSAAEHANATYSATTAVDGSDTIFCLIGITSELAPTKALLQYVPNAHVIGVSRNVEPIIQWYQQQITTGTAAPNTTLQVISADLLQDFPEISHWIVRTVQNIIQSNPNRTKFVLLPMGYMDGEACVRLTIAMDQIIVHVLDSFQKNNNDEESLKQLNITVGYWISPSTVYPIPSEAAYDSYKRYEADNILYIPKRWFSMLSFGTLLQPNSVVREIVKTGRDGKSTTTDNDKHYILNAVTNLQGPNYLLSKMLQQWRCIVLQHQQLQQHHSQQNNNNNIVVQVLAPQAPPTRTVSVTHNVQAAVAIDGLPYIAQPILTFDVEPCSTLMTAILLHQIQQPHPAPRSSPKSIHLFQVFWDGSVHGGIWRCPYSSDSTGILGYFIGQYMHQTKQRGLNPIESIVINK